MRGVLIIGYGVRPRKKMLQRGLKPEMAQSSIVGSAAAEAAGEQQLERFLRGSDGAPWASIHVILWGQFVKERRSPRPHVPRPSAQHRRERRVS